MFISMKWVIQHAMVVQISVKSQLNNFFFLHFAQTKDQNAIKKHW